MVFDGCFKMMHAEGCFRPMLFDLKTAPNEVHDLAKGSAHEAEIDRLYGYLAKWGQRMPQRTTRSDDDIAGMRCKSLREGILPFLKDGTEVDPEMTTAYRGPVAQNFTPEI